MIPANLWIENGSLSSIGARSAVITYERLTIGKAQLSSGKD